jgi:hypothetical protein
MERKEKVVEKDTVHLKETKVEKGSAIIKAAAKDNGDPSLKVIATTVVSTGTVPQIAKEAPKEKEKVMATLAKAKVRILP